MSGEMAQAAAALASAGAAAVLLAAAPLRPHRARPAAPAGAAATAATTPRPTPMSTGSALLHLGPRLLATVPRRPLLPPGRRPALP